MAENNYSFGGLLNETVEDNPNRYAKDSKRLTDKFYSDNTGGYYDPINNPDQIPKYLADSGKGLLKAGVFTAEQILNIPSWAHYGTGLLSYGIDKAWNGIEEDGMDYYDYVPHAEVDLARGRQPYSNMILKPYGTMLRKGLVDVPIEAGKILWSDPSPEGIQETLKLNPWLTPDYTAKSKDKYRYLPDPSSVQNTAEWGFMGLTSGSGYFAKIPAMMKIAMNKKYVIGGGLWGAANSTVKEMFPEWEGTGKDAWQTTGFVAMNLITDLATRNITKVADNFMMNGFTKTEAKALEKELPELKKIIEASKGMETPLQAWEFISTQMQKTPGLQQYLRMMIQADPRFGQVLGKQYGDVAQHIDNVFNSAILKVDGSDAFSGNFNMYDSANRIIKKYEGTSKSLENNWQKTLGADLNKTFDIGTKANITKIIDDVKTSKKYLNMSDRQKREFDAFLGQLYDSQNINKLWNNLREDYTKFRFIDDGKGDNIPKQGGFKQNFIELKRLLTKELENFSPNFKQANEDFVAETEKFISSTPAYLTIQKIQKAAKNGDPDLVIETAIESMYNQNLSTKQLNDVMDAIESMGGSTIIPELLRIRVQQHAMKVFNMTDTPTSRVKKFADGVVLNQRDRNIYKDIVERINKDKNLKGNESAIIVSSLEAWLDQAIRLPRVAGESMTGLYSQFQKDMGAGKFNSLNPLQWSDNLKDAYRQYNIQKFGDLLLDPYFFEKIVDMKINQSKPDSFIVRYITNYIAGNVKLGGYGVLAQDEYRTWQYKNEKSNELYEKNKKNSSGSYNLDGV